MGQNDISEDLDTFIEKILEPSEAFARIFQNAYVDVMFITGKEIEIKAKFDDVAQVSGALTTLTRLRLRQLAGLLQEEIGVVEVLQPHRDMVIDYEINGVDVKKKQQTAYAQNYDKSPESNVTETEALKKRTQEIKEELEQEKRKKQIRDILGEAEEDLKLHKKQ